MLKGGLIWPSPSQHEAPTFCVKKLWVGGSGMIIEIIGSYWYSCMDLLSGYCQFRMYDADIKYTAFQTADGSYEYLVIPMELTNVPATFNDGIRRLLKDLTDFCLSYFDDIYIFTRGNDIQSHFDALDTALTMYTSHCEWSQCRKTSVLRVTRSILFRMSLKMSLALENRRSHSFDVGGTYPTST
ncbi:hypothetical protein PHMEG_00029303 [Phytophthora megakarya]|uniref:Reverse transcriptase domain-containing protein n=1 Tax=Phytophthora megakarya TaxID=4795 RepID=A0A225V317_9STRA|nr:hypothetical protein PHMEG_00029303 [Phytophthora megakarya]